MIDDRHLCYHRLDSAVNCRGVNYDAARIAGAPDADTLGIKTRQALEKTHPVTVILHLDQRKELTAGLTLALAEAPVIYRQYDIAGTREELALLNQGLLGLGGAVTDDQTWKFPRLIETWRQIQIG